MVDIKVPNIGEDSLEVTEILVKIGDHVTINQPLLIIEGDKLSTEIPSPYSGVITKIHINIGDKVGTGSLILSINSDHIDLQSSNNQKNVFSQNITNQDHSLTYQKYSHNFVHNNNCTKTNNEQKSSSELIVHATPTIRHMAHKFGIDLSKINGSGRKGRILKEDIEKYLHSLSTSHIHSYQYSDCIHKKSSTEFVKDTTSNFNKFGDIEIIKLNKTQKTSGTNLQKSWSTIPHVTQFDKVDITNLEIFRKQQNIEIAKKEMKHKITILSFIIKAVGKALEIFPRFNSSISKDGDTLILKKYINIGIAVDTQKGLLVPVLRNINNKGIMQLSQELSEISQKARIGNQLTPADIQGGSFTISNLGGIGGTSFTPIINSPEVAILGISQSTIHPVWTGKKFLPKLILPLSLSYDHRVIDGADGARFINLVKNIISDIRLLCM